MAEHLPGQPTKVASGCPSEFGSEKKDQAASEVSSGFHGGAAVTLAHSVLNAQS